ncbi:hypothetical protein Q7P37_009754 [Cladosporium fusiforme]
MGFDAIWISPITKNVEGITPHGEAYHGYWQQDLYSLNPHFGTSHDLRELARTLHSRGMYLMVDIVVNHNAWNGAPHTVNFSDLQPFNHSTQYNMPPCEIDYGDLENKYSIDGLRLDTVLNVEKDFWDDFSLAANGMYMLAEVFHWDADIVYAYQKHIPGLLNYPVHFPLIRAFESSFGKIQDLAKAIVTAAEKSHDTSLLGSFSENHDIPRFPTKSNDTARAKNVLTFTMLSDGIPILYQGQEQHYQAMGGSTDPYNREALWLSDYNNDHELYQFVRRLNYIRKQASRDDNSFLERQAQVLYTDSNVIAIQKAELLIVLSNRGLGSVNHTREVSSDYEPGSSITELLTCTKMIVDASGITEVTIMDGRAK